MVEVAPSVYSFNVYMPGEGPAAMPRRVVVPEGARFALDPIVLGGGDAAVRGRVVDRRGVGFVGVEVVAYPGGPTEPGEVPYNLADAVSRTKTDAGGRFVMANLPSGELMVQAHPYGSLEKLGSPTRLKAPIEPARVIAVAHSEVVLGDFVGALSRPFSLRVRVELNEVLVRRQDPQLGKLRPSSVFVVPESQFGDEGEWQKLRVGDDGFYLFVCESPHEALVVVVRRRGFSASVRRVEVVADAEHELEIRYP